MLLIRNEQMNIFGEYMVQQFVDQTSSYLRSTYPARLETMTEVDLHKMIHMGIERATAYKMECEDEVVAFVEGMILLGDNFDTNPSYAQIEGLLRDTNLSVDEKLTRLQESYMRYSKERS